MTSLIDHFFGLRERRWLVGGVEATVEETLNDDDWLEEEGLEEEEVLQQGELLVVEETVGRDNLIQQNNLTSSQCASLATQNKIKTPI